MNDSDSVVIQTHKTDAISVREIRKTLRISTEEKKRVYKKILLSLDSSSIKTVGWWLVAVISAIVSWKLFNSSLEHRDILYKENFVMAKVLQITSDRKSMVLEADGLVFYKSANPAMLYLAEKNGVVQVTRPFEAESYQARDFLSIVLIGISGLSLVVSLLASILLTLGFFIDEFRYKLSQLKDNRREWEYTLDSKARSIQVDNINTQSKKASDA